MEARELPAELTRLREQAVTDNSTMVAPRSTRSPQSVNVPGDAHLFNDEQLAAYIRDSHIAVMADHPAQFHRAIYDEIESVLATEGNPGNNILPRVPLLRDILEHPAVIGALTSILGPDYYLYLDPFCHCSQHTGGCRGAAEGPGSLSVDLNAGGGLSIPPARRASGRSRGAWPPAERIAPRAPTATSGGRPFPVAPPPGEHSSRSSKSAVRRPSS